ncbi:hypothetical protein ACJMK2_014375 [Sinanodonta woodiana]|uniref:Uncharacterized protein n=1 Tax=Sinanodonta woodiana TaxID=1069815 RepID=A0ABD3V180_SINWO
MAIGKIAKIAIAWTFIISGGLYAFYLAKKDVNSNRVLIMKAKKRIADKEMADARAAYEEKKVKSASGHDKSTP